MPLLWLSRLLLPRAHGTALSCDLLVCAPPPTHPHSHLHTLTHLTRLGAPSVLQIKDCTLSDLAHAPPSSNPLLWSTFILLILTKWAAIFLHTLPPWKSGGSTWPPAPAEQTIFKLKMWAWWLLATLPQPSGGDRSGRRKLTSKEKSGSILETVLAVVTPDTALPVLCLAEPVNPFLQRKCKLGSQLCKRQGQSNIDHFLHVSTSRV